MKKLLSLLLAVLLMAAAGCAGGPPRDEAPALPALSTEEAAARPEVLPRAEEASPSDPASGLTVSLDEDAAMAWITGDCSGLYARVSMVIDMNGKSGLYVTQVPINADGSALIPVFYVPGLTVKGISIALVPTLEDIESVTPTVTADDFRML